MALRFFADIRITEIKLSKISKVTDIVEIWENDKFVENQVVPT
jgi:hypothetical protein